MIKLVIPGTPPSLNQWSRMHWSRAARIKKQWENDILYVFLSCKAKGAFPQQKAQIKVTYFFATNRRRDADNLNLKFILDGIVKAGIIQDDSTKVIGQPVTAWEVDKHDPRVEIEISESSLLADQPFVD
jgi:Holliday junction resolvase RusA-like endonuclease